jgi:hypothetical protein
MASSEPTDITERQSGAGGLSRRGQLLGALGVFLAVCLVTAPTTGDFGLTWDEPAYRHSQLVSARWWSKLFRVRSAAELGGLLDADELLYSWPYGRHGINFHPPLAGQLNLLTFQLFGGILREIPARRMASVVEFGLTAALLFGFLARRSGWVAGLIAAGALVCMPRLYGQAHLIDTDIPGMLIWVATAFAFWIAVMERRGGFWSVLVGILLGLAFVEKMAAVFVLVPVLLWLGGTALARWLGNPAGRAPAVWDAAITLGLLLVPLGMAALEMKRLMDAGPPAGLPPPQLTNLFVHRPPSRLPDGFLAVPWLIWIIRELVRRVARGNSVLGVPRPVLGTLSAILAWGPLVGWLGNPAWWRESMVRLAHYGSLSFGRKGALPDIQILYRNQLYEFSLPWDSAWVLIGITVPVSLLIAALAGLPGLLRRPHRELVKWYFFLHLSFLPLMRFFPTPAHDGVRLFLPTFVFLAGFCGWGGASLARLIARVTRWDGRRVQAVVAGFVLLPAAWQLVKIHPFELSYYNEIIGGPARAWERGFELTYWYDAFTPGALRELNAKLPEGASLMHANELSTPPTFDELLGLGMLRADLDLEQRSPEFRYRWLLTHDSKASAFTRLLFAMRPWWALRPSQLQGARVASVMSPEAASRAWALQLLTDGPYTGPPLPRTIPERAAPLSVFEPSFAWARSDPDALRAAARSIARRRGPGEDPGTQRLWAILTRYDNPAAGRNFLKILLDARPAALIEAVEILIRDPEGVRRHLTRYGYIEPGDESPATGERRYLDDELPKTEPESPAA